MTPVSVARGLLSAVEFSRRVWSQRDGRLSGGCGKDERFRFEVTAGKSQVNVDLIALTVHHGKPVLHPRFHVIRRPSAEKVFELHEAELQRTAIRCLDNVGEFSVGQNGRYRKVEDLTCPTL